ncbi:MAG: four helix bundle protein [Bacteroidales bacterium]|nr:four helix bundle protein [Bacteroidales bacterium]
MALQTHKDLKVWQESRKLVKEIYSLTSRFPKDEIYSLTAQIKRAAISIPSNIAEGAARDSNKEYIHFLYISLGSVAELDTQLIIARDQSFINEKEFNEISEKLDSIGKMLSGLIKYRQSKP